MLPVVMGMINLVAPEISATDRAERLKPRAIDNRWQNAAMNPTWAAEIWRNASVVNRLGQPLRP